MQPNDHISID